MPATAGLPTVDAADPAQIGEATQQAETGIAFVAVGFRVLVVTQILIAGVPTVQRLNPGPGAGYLLALSLILGCSIWACFSVMKKKSVRTGGWHWPDMIVGLVAFPLLAYCLPPQDYVGAWRFWAPGFAVNTVILAAAWMGLRGSVTYATLVALVDLAIVARAPSVTWLSALPDALTYPGFAIVITAFLSYVRKVAATADRNTELAAHAMKVAEIERFRLTVHDATGILQLLSSTSTPSSQRPALMRQGTREARRLRAYLAEDYSAPLPSPQSLGEVIQNATEGFNDLPLCLCVELGSTVVLAPRVALGVGRALTTVLHNARRHAEAKTVFVHADCLDGRWELSVRDDGIGFDPSTASFGFGLGTQVIEALQRLEIDVTIDSAPGEGTAVVMVGSAS